MRFDTLPVFFEVDNFTGERGDEVIVTKQGTDVVLGKLAPSGTPHLLPLRMADFTRLAVAWLRRVGYTVTPPTAE